MKWWLAELVKKGRMSVSEWMTVYVNEVSESETGEEFMLVKSYIAQLLVQEMLSNCIR